MAKAEWEAEDFEPKVFPKPLLNSDRWDGEDEEDDIKDNWDDDEEEKKEDENKETPTVVAMQPKKKRPLAQILAEKEEKRRKELEERLKQEEEEENKVLTAEEILSEKLRQQKLQEEADLELTKETFGVFDSTSGIDQMHPSTKEDFDLFRKELINKVTKYDSSPHYLLFLEDFCRELCLTLQYEDIKKIASTLNALATEKQKAQKAVKAKKKSKKSTVNAGKGSLTILDYGDDFDDIGI